MHFRNERIIRFDSGFYYLTGFTEPANVEFYFANEVFRIHEDPRVTKPYSDKQWDAIYALGDLVENHLQANDVRLTMGGEPTFVSKDDMESAQWNTDADGEDKRNKAYELACNLNEEFADGKAMIHIGQGKWYPGEVLPRWQYGIYWRKDGLPFVQNRFAYGDPNADYGYTFADAEKFISQLTDIYHDF